MFGTVNCIINKFILTTHRSKQSRRLGSVGILFWDANFKIKKANTVLIFFTWNSWPEFCISYIDHKTLMGRGHTKNPNPKHKKNPAQTAAAFTFSRGFYALGQNKGYVTHCQIARRLKESALLRTCIMMAPRTHKEFVPHVRIRVC